MNYTEPTSEAYPKIDDKNWFRTFSLIWNLLRACRGNTSKLPLAYVVRAEEAVTPEDEDNTQDNSLEERLIQRAPHKIGNNKHPHFVQDNKKVYLILETLLKGTLYEVYIEPHRAAYDGRKAYNDLYKECLGPNNADMMLLQAETAIRRLTYNGETPTWNFDKYARAHQEQHNIVESLKVHGIQGMDSRRRVIYLNAGILTDALDIPKSQIRTDPDLRKDFKEAVTVYKDFIRSKKPGTAGGGRRNISDLRTEPWDSALKRDTNRHSHHDQSESRSHRWSDPSLNMTRKRAAKKIQNL